MSKPMVRKLIIASMILTLGVTAVGCGDPSRSDVYNNQAQQTQQTNRPAAQTRINDGQYPVQQATYDDANGEYTVMLLNTAAGQPSNFRATNLPMARLTNEEVAAGQKSYLKVENGQPSLHLTEDFKIEYIHNVTDTRVDPQTGRQETVVVRQEPSFWTPFAGALAGQALGSLLFRPQYYVPPLYQPGLPMTGFGGYGSTYGQAVDRYQSRYQQPPIATRNRQVFRSTGQLRSPNYGQSGYRTSPSYRTTSPSYGNNRPSGSGYGSSNLRQGSRSNSRSYRSPSFGSGGSRSRSSFGSRRR